MLQQHGFTEHGVLPIKSWPGFFLGLFLVTPIAVSALSIILMYINVSKTDTTLDERLPPHFLVSVPWVPCAESASREARFT